MSDLRTEIQAVYDKHGTLTPDILVEEARPKTHPLHSRIFDRNRTEAAESWYRHRAHELIQSVKVVYKMTEEGPHHVRSWQAIRSETGYVYEPSEEIVNDDLKTQIVLQDMQREWKQLQRRYGNFKEFVSMVREDVGVA